MEKTNMAYENARWRCDVGARDVMCNSCVHYHGFAKCDAFPDRIPADLVRRHEHDTPYPGDNGIRYEKGENPITRGEFEKKE